MESTNLGRHHPRIKEIRRAFRDGSLTGDGLLAVEGPRMIAEAQKSGLEIVESFRREGEHFDFQAGSIEYVVDSDVMDGLAMTQSPQGVIALVRPPHFELENILSSDNPLLVVLCGVQDPGNVGTILRLSEAFGATM